MGVPAPESSRGLTSKGRQTRQAIEQAARKLFAERGFHGTTLADITSAAGKSPAVFYRYFADKEDLLAALAESFLHDVVAPSGLSVHLPDSPDDYAFFTSVVTGYWNIFKQNIGIMIAVAQLATTQQRFAAPRSRVTALSSTRNTPRRPSRCCSRTSPLSLSDSPVSDWRSATRTPSPPCRRFGRRLCTAHNERS
jgi:AcrR family transcriptional regulator